MPLDFLFTIYSSYKIKHRAKNGGSVKMVLYIFGFWRWKVKRITIFNIVFVQSAKRLALKAAWNALSQKSYGLLTCKCQWWVQKFPRKLLNSGCGWNFMWITPVEMNSPGDESCRISYPVTKIRGQRPEKAGFRLDLRMMPVNYRTGKINFIWCQA